MRTDGRLNNELRKINFIDNFIKNPMGSCLVEFGNTRVIVSASFEDNLPKWMEKDSEIGWVTAEYSLLPASTSQRCQRERTNIRQNTRNSKVNRKIIKSLR